MCVCYCGPAYCNGGRLMCVCVCVRERERERETNIEELQKRKGYAGIAC